jgi:cold shock protein
MPMGHVKWFNDNKGYGFITPRDGGEEVMVHQSVIEGGGYRTLDNGEPVEYDAEKGAKGMKATRVRRLAPVDAVARR